MKQLVFDVTDANTIADSDSVGAYLRSSDGTLLTHTNVGGKEALDVNVAAGVNVEVDLDHADDSVRLGDGTTLTTVTTFGGKNGLDVNMIEDLALANNTIANASNDLDVADTAEDVVASPLANRKYLFIYNNGNRTAYIGASGVTAANGFPLNSAATMMLRAGAAIDIEWVSANTSQQLRTLELS